MDTLLARYDSELTARITGGTISLGEFVARHTPPVGLRPWLHLIADPGDLIDEVIEDEIAHHPAGFEWTVFRHSSPPNLLDKLRSHGFAIGEREALVFYDMEEHGIPPAPNLDVRQVRTSHDLVAFRHVAQSVFAKDYEPTTADLRMHIESNNADHVGFVAYMEDIPSACARLYCGAGRQFAGLYGGGTLPIFRGRGLYRALVAARAEFARRRGSRFLQVDALSSSLPILLSLGFVHASDTWPCTFQGNPP